LAHSVPLSRFTSQVGGGSAFYVRQHSAMNAPSSIPLAKRILVSFGISWLAAVSLGIIYGVRVVGRISIADLWIMGVIPIATIISSVIAVFLTPLIAWILRSYAVIKWIAVLWLLMVLWVLAIIGLSQNGPLALDSAVLLTVGGLVGIRFMTNR